MVPFSLTLFLPCLSRGKNQNPTETTTPPSVSSMVIIINGNSKMAAANGSIAAVSTTKYNHTMIFPLKYVKYLRILQQLGEKEGREADDLKLLFAAETDNVDGAIAFFRANVFFKNFDIKSSANELLLCTTLWNEVHINLGFGGVPVPGEAGFPFAGLFPFPQSDEEAELFRNYLKQIREETSGRLLGAAYRPNGTPNKWWIAFAKRKFLNIIVPQH
ncbi:hypothetical protein C5167_011610 [Papaver somniferum]|uniref:Actin-related protein 2/3 complex subunit 3 n=1 Tax=Papaver somniferum TaxID=3469 RepID=A0A4Y7K7E6_PAPSO|nr:hypothetical protein C5167_011610 [Papaver somniferum]